MAKKSSAAKADYDSLSKHYIELMNTIDKLTAEKEDVRKQLLEGHSAGVDLSVFGVNVEERFSYDFEKCAAVFKAKTGKDPPTIHFPEQIIPAHDDIDTDIFQIMLEREQIREGKLSYTVKRKK